MTQADYEKKYKEALEDMRVIYPNLKGDAKLAVEHAFPELKESEDERIRKEIIALIRAHVTPNDHCLVRGGSTTREEAAEKFARFYDNGTCDGIAQDCFKAGAEWQKAKMMKGAVEGKVFMSFAPGHNQMVMADVDLPTNTKVKIIIVKEEEE